LQDRHEQPREREPPAVVAGPPMPLMTSLRVSRRGYVGDPRFPTNAHGVLAASVLALWSKRWLTRELERDDGGPQHPTSALAERCGDSALSDRRTEATGGIIEGRCRLIDRHNQRPLLPSLNATIANDAHDWQRAAPAPPSPAT
jgi:hypothetical protein